MFKLIVIVIGPEVLKDSLVFYLTVIECYNFLDNDNVLVCLIANRRLQLTSFCVSVLHLLRHRSKVHFHQANCASVVRTIFSSDEPMALVKQGSVVRRNRRPSTFVVVHTFEHLLRSNWAA